jgi:RIO-like serine/threonine protein kinase
MVEITNEEKVRLAYAAIRDYCCAYDCGKGKESCVIEFMEMLRHEHPTHQQSIARFMQKIIAYYANQYDKKYFDMRNEASCKLFAELHKISKENPLPFF